MDESKDPHDQPRENNNTRQDTAISSDERSVEKSGIAEQHVVGKEIHLQQSKQGVVEQDIVIEEIHPQLAEDDTVVDNIQLHQDSFSIATYSLEVLNNTIQEAEPEVQLIETCPFCNKNLRAGSPATLHVNGCSRNEENRSRKSPKRKR